MNAEVVVEIIKRQGAVSAVDLRQAGIARTTLHYMANRGVRCRVARGVYALAGHYLTFEAFAGIMTSAPRSVICLLSALQFHEITTQMPFETWVAIESNASKPKSPNVRTVKLTGRAFSEGIESHQKEGVSVRVYCPAKTVAVVSSIATRLVLM